MLGDGESRKTTELDASVDRSTVYRTLQLLKRHGLIDELDLMHIHGEGHYYERKLNRDHIHMACLRCGKIMEFVSDIFENLKGQVEKDCRFRNCGVAIGNRRILRGVFEVGRSRKRGRRTNNSPSGTSRLSPSFQRAGFAL